MVAHSDIRGVSGDLERQQAPSARESPVLDCGGDDAARLQLALPLEHALLGERAQAELRAARGDWRTGGFDLSATQPASPDEKTNKGDAPKAASKLREPRLHMRGLSAPEDWAWARPGRTRARRAAI